MQNLRRTVKNVAYNYSDAQKAVREATSNNPWGPTTTQMIDIADYMRNPVAFNEVMSIIWKRLNDSGKNWRHVFKTLVLLDFLIKAGNDRVASLCKHNIYAIETLRDFQHVEEGRDQGIHIRNKAKELSAFLKGQAPETNGTSTSTSNTDVVRSQPAAPVSRPTNAAEEAEQLRLAMELSLQEQKRQDSQKDDFEVRLQQALEESKREAEEAKSKLASKGEFELTGKPKSNIDDLLSLGDITSSQQPSSSLAWYNTGMNDMNDPWAPVQSEVPPVGNNNHLYDNSKIPGLDVDPWSGHAAPVSFPPYSSYGMDSIQPPSASSVAPNNLRTYADPFTGNYDSLVDYDKQNTTNLAAQSSKDFLGVTNANVDVDSLVGLNMTPSNPFLQPERKNLTLNEMRAQQQGYPTPPISPYPSSIPPSQIPISPNNPFASAF